MASFGSYRDHLTQRSDHYTAAADVDYLLLQLPGSGWDASAIARFTSSPDAQAGVVQAPYPEDAYRSAYVLAVETIQEKSSLVNAVSAANPVLLLAPFKGDGNERPQQVLRGLVVNLLERVLPLLGPDASPDSVHGLLAGTYGGLFWDYDVLEIEEGLRALEGLERLVAPEAAAGKLLCLVVDVDRAESEETWEQVRRFTSVLERLFVTGGLGDVLFFVSRPYDIVRYHNNDRMITL